MVDSRVTVLHSWHEENGANMALFGNYDMPLWYKTGAKAEHLAVIQSAGIFDTSHMAVVSVKGAGARAVLQCCLSKDLDSCLGKGKPLVDGRCVYGIFLKDDGTVIDDAIVYQLQAESFMVVVNAAMGRAIAAHLSSNAGAGAVVIEDLTDRVGKMDIQGPQSGRILKKIIKNPDSLFEKLIYFSFKGGFDDCVSSTTVELKDGTPVLVSRTGYTGEFGFELFVAIDKLLPLWKQLLAAGSNEGLLACGLAARDSLRAGAVLPLSHQDVGAWPFANNPWQFALAWNEEHNAFTKPFIGSDVLAKREWSKFTLPFAGFDPRKIAAGESTSVLSPEGETIGTILTCTTDMAIGRVDGEIVSIVEAGTHPEGFQAKGLCCGFVMLDKKFNPGDLVVLTDGKRKIKVEIRADVRPDRSARNPVGIMVD